MRPLIRGPLAISRPVVTGLCLDPVILIERSVLYDRPSGVIGWVFAEVVDYLNRSVVVST